MTQAFPVADVEAIQVQRFDEAQQLNPEKSKKMITSLFAMQRALNEIHGQIILDNDKYYSRKLLFIATNGMLLGEIFYTAFQYSVTKNGLIKVGSNSESAMAIAAIGASLDFIASVCTNSPANDANLGVFSNVTSHYSCTSKILGCIIFILSSLISYPVAVAATLEGMFLIINTFPGFYFVAAILGVPTFLSSYYCYLIFNNKSAEKTFYAIEEYLNLNKADHDFGRKLQIFYECISHLIYNSISFSFIAADFFPSLHVPVSCKTKQLLATLVFIVTATYASTSAQIRRIVNKWSANDFAYVEEQEKEYARASLPYSIYLSKEMLVGIISAIGASMIMHSIQLKSVAAWASSIVTGAVLLFITFYSQRSLAINIRALEAIDKDQLQIRKIRTQGLENENIYHPLINSEDDYYPSPINHELGYEIFHNLSENVTREKKIKLANNAFFALSETFENNRLLKYIAFTFSIGSCAARFFGFLYFIDYMSTLFSINLPLCGVVGIGLAVAPSYLQYYYNICYMLGIENIIQKLAEAYVIYSNDQSDSENSILFEGWLWRNSPKLLLKLYFKGALQYTAEQIAYALERRAKELEEVNRILAEILPEMDNESEGINNISKLGEHETNKTTLLMHADDNLCSNMSANNFEHVYEKENDEVNFNRSRSGSRLLATFNSSSNVEMRESENIQLPQKAKCTKKSSRSDNEPLDYEDIAKDNFCLQKEESNFTSSSALFKQADFTNVKKLANKGVQMLHVDDQVFDEPGLTAIKIPSFPNVEMQKGIALYEEATKSEDLDENSKKQLLTAFSCFNQVLISKVETNEVYEFALLYAAKILHIFDRLNEAMVTLDSLLDLADNKSIMQFHAYQAQGLIFYQKERLVDALYSFQKANGCSVSSEYIEESQSYINELLSKLQELSSSTKEHVDMEKSELDTSTEGRSNEISPDF